MPQTGLCTDITCAQELTELYECHCCNWLVCLTHLLQHVEVTQQGKKKQLDNLRNDLTSVTYTLELLVERKTHEITQGKELITRAKAKLDTPNCSIEEIQQIFEEINQAIASEGGGEWTVWQENPIGSIRFRTHDRQSGILITRGETFNEHQRCIRRGRSCTRRSLINAMCSSGH